MKVLKTNKLFLAMLYSALRNLKTDQFNNDNEMVQYRDKIKPIFENLLVDYCKLWEGVKNINSRINLKEVSEAEIKNFNLEHTYKFAKLDELSKKENIELELEDSDFNLLFDFFSKLGKTIFKDPDEYLEFKDSFNETNSQPKTKK